MKKQKILSVYHLICTNSTLALCIILLISCLTGCGKKGDPKPEGCDLNQLVNYKYPSLDDAQ